MSTTKFFSNLMLTIGFVFLVSALQAKVRIPGQSELIEMSEAICLVEVKEIIFWKKPNTYIYERNKVRVLKVLKWRGERPKEIEVVSARYDPALGDVEDCPAEFPEKGKQALIFLAKNADGDWELADKMEGLWEFDGKEFTNPFRPSLENFEKRVKSMDSGKK